ncbi:MAG: hypothetical protein R3F48_10880 [Candidatus Zixiibacteriota bacterium]
MRMLLPALLTCLLLLSTAFASGIGQNELVPDYSGHVRVYIIEPESRYYDYDFYNYENGFLDFAIDQSVTIPYQDSVVITQVWDGIAAGFGDVTEDNIAAIAAVCNSTGHPSNADPWDETAPFTAYYNDASAYAEAGATGYDVAEGGFTHTVLLEEGSAHG